MGGFVCDFEDGSASFAARGMRVPHSKKKPSGGKDNFTMKTIDLFFDGLSGWSRAHNVLAPQDDPEWKVMIKANLRLRRSRSTLKESGAERAPRAERAPDVEGKMQFL